MEQEERRLKAAEGKKRQEELERQRLAAEQARLEEERRQATAEKARLEQEEPQRKAAEEKARQEELERQRLAAERPARLLIAAIFVAILIVGWLVYRASSSSRTTPSALRYQELLTLRGHTGSVDGVAYSPDGKRLATASSDQTAKVWDVEP